MTIQQKAKAYDEALEKAKEMVAVLTNTGGVVKTDDIQYLFPELIESEDEKIRKEIIDILDSYEVAHLRRAGLPTRIPEYIAWLEKQKEPKQWSKEDEIYLQNIICAVNEAYPEGSKEILNWIATLQPKKRWFKADTTNLYHIKSILKNPRSIMPNTYEALNNWLDDIEKRFS